MKYPLLYQDFEFFLNKEVDFLIKSRNGAYNLKCIYTCNKQVKHIYISTDSSENTFAIHQLSML